MHVCVCVCVCVQQSVREKQTQIMTKTFFELYNDKLVNESYLKSDMEKKIIKKMELHVKIGFCLVLLPLIDYCSFYTILTNILL